MAKMEVKRVGIFSYAKITAVTNAAFGLLLGVIYGLFFMAVGGAIMAGGGRNSGGAGAGSFAIGLVIMVATPLLVGLMGFIAGAIGAIIYNVAASFVGGIELELENAETVYAAPPPPQWSADNYQPGQQQQYPYS